MKYQVMYNNGTRIRVRSGQAAFTKNEGYGISALLLENNFIMMMLKTEIKSLKHLIK